jgi:uncharacterized protein YukE
MAITIDNDPEAIRRYRGQIQEAKTQLEAQLQKTEEAIQKVSASWKDNNFMQFQANFSRDKEDIKPLCSILDDYDNNILRNLEQKLRNYLNSPTSC